MQQNRARPNVAAALVAAPTGRAHARQGVAERRQGAARAPATFGIARDTCGLAWHAKIVVEPPFQASIIARLNEGTRVSLVREPVEGGIWLPTSIRFNGQGRAVLFRKLNVDLAIDWYDYKRVK